MAKRIVREGGRMMLARDSCEFKEEAHNRQENAIILAAKLSSFISKNHLSIDTNIFP